VFTGGVALIAEAVPDGVPLEGFLFPDTYLFRADAQGPAIVKRLLENFVAQLPPNHATLLAERNLTLRDIVTIASLIEREAAAGDERALIAAVIYNRLAIGQPLQIDAATQYALGHPDDWWPSLAGVDMYAVPGPYNTYAFAGLPPGPIANPGQASLRAAFYPASVNYLYYRALCDGSGRHAFAVTYAEHLANACP
jgi:UPF0755 protein